MNIRLTILAAATGLGIGLIAFQARPQGSPEAGMAKAAVCVACHGVNGNSTNPLWPNLAGQQANYIARQLQAFRDGSRSDPLMTPMATGLSDQDIADLAAYFAVQTPTGLEADPSYWEAGQALYRGGNPEKEIPACIACHGPLGTGNGPAAYPGVRAQHSAYIQKQLQDYASDARTTDPGEMMRTIAKRLSPEEIRNVASYVQGLR